MSVYKTRIVYTTFVADILIQDGEKMLHVRPDMKDTSKNVFVFENSTSFDANLEAAIQLQLKAQGRI